jgi:hypothetical protein
MHYSFSICGSLRTVSLDTYSSSAVDDPTNRNLDDSRRSSHDPNALSTQLPNVSEVATTDGTSSSDEAEGRADSPLSPPQPLRPPSQTGAASVPSDYLAPSSGDDAMKFRRASLTLEVGQQDQQKGLVTTSSSSSVLAASPVTMPNFRPLRRKGSNKGRHSPGSSAKPTYLNSPSVKAGVLNSPAGGGGGSGSGSGGVKSGLYSPIRSGAASGWKKSRGLPGSRLSLDIAEHGEEPPTVGSR